MKPGRNDPCPCGSGKKYKHCCLAAERARQESPSEIAFARVRRATEGLPKLLINFVAGVYAGEAIEEAWDEFTLWEGSELDTESPLNEIFLAWFFYKWAPDPAETSIEESLHGRSPASVLLERRAGRLDPVLERYLRACVDAPFSFHEILRYDPGRGFRSRDVITGEELEVLDRVVSGESMSAGDILFGQLVPIDGIVLVEAFSSYALSPIHKIEIIELRESFKGTAREEAGGDDPRRKYELEIRSLYLQLMDRYIDGVPPVLHNTDGELLKLQDVIFEVDDADAAFNLLTRAGCRADDTALARAPDGAFRSAQLSWTKRGNRVNAGWDNTILASIEITGARLVAHVSSDERARAVREMVEQTLGTTAHYVRSEVIEDDLFEPDVLFANEDEIDDEARCLPDSPEIREDLSRLLERYYDDWVTQEIPALGLKRPIDVVREPSGREKVEALVAQMEREAALMQPGAGEAALQRLRERLGLTRS